MDSFEEYQDNNNNDQLDNKHYENFFELPPNQDIELNISIDEDIMNSPMTNAFTKATSYKDTKSSFSNNSYAIELKRKKNREASRVSRQKKKEDIITLVKTNEQLKVRIKELNQQVENNLCAECKRAINSPIGSQINLKEALSKNTATISSTSISSSPIQAKTAMFISMVVIFCVIVNTFSDKNMNYLRKVTMNNTFNDYFNTIEISNAEDSINVTKCFDYLKYYYSSFSKENKKENEYKEKNKGVNIVQQITPIENKTCQSIYITQDLKDDDEDDDNNSSIHFSINVDKHYLISQIFKENNSFQNDPTNSHYVQLDCINLYLQPAAG